MATIYLKYIVWNDVTKVWDTSAAHSFSCLELDSNDIKDIDAGQTLRQIKWVHKKGERKKWLIKIGANVLYDNTEFNWLVTFFNSGRWELSEDNITYVEVVLEADEMPKSRTANHKLLRNVEFELIQKNPS